MTSTVPPSTLPPPVKTVGIIAKTRLDEAARVVADVSDWLTERGINVVVEADTARLAGREHESTCSRDDLPAVADLVLVLGGDGTLLGVASRVARVNANIPILAVNFGSLGFLTEITLPELYGSLESVLAGTAGIDERQMLRSQVLRDDEIIADRLVLNDVVIGKAALSNIIEFSITVGDQFVTSCRADGLIIASPNRLHCVQPGRGWPHRSPAGRCAAADTDSATHADEPTDRPPNDHTCADQPCARRYPPGGVCEL